MDAEKFGGFIALCRKEKNMTQSELAQKLNITDKAVSRWERGKGFPDISILVPLSEALDISVLELMRSEKVEQAKQSYTDEEVKSVMTRVAELERSNDRDNRLIARIVSPVVIIAAVLSVLTGHASPLGGLIFGAFPALAVTGICLFAVNRDDRGSRKAYGLIMLLGTGVSLVFLYLMGISSLVLAIALFALLCIVVGITVK